nr:hypothetical protein [uncultured Prevotella sp.]
MKKNLIVAAFAVLSAVGAYAQGNFQTVKDSAFTLHIFNSGDVMGDASYIIETPKNLVTMEEPLFKSGAEEFDAYVKKLGKKVNARIVDYHEGATGKNAIMQPEGMAKFMHEGVYDAMMKGFQQNFGDKMVARPTGKVKEVKFGDTVKLNGVEYTFNQGPKNDFPASNILIGKKFVLLHWAPAMAHMNALQLANRAAVAQALEGLKAAKATGAEYFLGGHGGLAEKDAIDFQISYLEKVQNLLENCKNAPTFVVAMKGTFPGLAGEQGLEALAQNLYK